MKVLMLKTWINLSKILTRDVNMLQRFNEINTRVDAVEGRYVGLHFETDSSVGRLVGQSKMNRYAVAERTCSNNDFIYELYFPSVPLTL